MKLTYKKAGVDIKKTNLFTKKIKSLAKSTARKGWTGDIGAFSALFKPAVSSYEEPLIVASTDGVGTKLMLAKRAGRHGTIGIDLVAMCVNDIITCGAEPLFFLDYFATGKFSPKVSYEVLKGIAKGCRIAGSALIGGETAELPGLYKKGDYDLAGFSVGIVDRKDAIDGSKIQKNDVILGLASSGLHSNGFSLARKVFSGRALTGKILKQLLKPTTIYVRPVLDCIKRFEVKGVANITGGGFYDNIVRVLPGSFKAVIDKNAWPIPSIFKLIAKKGNVDEKEMFRTFNMGIGMILVLSQKEAEKAGRRLSEEHGLESWVIGEVVQSGRGVTIV